MQFCSKSKKALKQSLSKNIIFYAFFACSFVGQGQKNQTFYSITQNISNKAAAYVVNLAQVLLFSSF
jgi:hypothetical protein